MTARKPVSCTSSALTLLALALLSCVPSREQSGNSVQAPDTRLDPNLEIVTLPLWPNKVPGALGTAPEDTPTLTVFRPSHPNGTAVIVDPGGSYLFLAAVHEGRQPADRLAELGVTAFVLKYRLGPRYRYPVPLEDAQRAVRVVRSLAPKLGYNADRIGMMGFSAGGHLAAMAGVSAETAAPGAPDPIDRISSRLNFLVLVYPWLNAMQPQVEDPREGNKRMINYCSVTQGLTQEECVNLAERYTPALHVDRSTPPAFLVATENDNVVPVTASVDFYTAMHRAGDDVELHIFDHGPHGFGTAGESATLAVWQDLLANWLRAHGWLTPSPPSTRP